MKLAIITCAVFPDMPTAEQKLWIFLASCRKFGIIPHLYGVGDRWSIYRDIKLTKQLAFLKSPSLCEYDRCLYTDSWDAMFTGPIDEIVRKYQALGSPDILTSASHQLANVSNEEERYPNVFPKEPKYRYPHVGGWIGSKDAMIAAFERMELNPSPTSDDCFDFFDGVQNGWFKPAIDSDCDIFQVTHEDCDVDPRDGRLVSWGPKSNGGNVTQPCVYHMPGGYTDQISGKDARMIPWAQRLGIIP